tara:strand:- start:130 stop:1332 length:1203 start_codon:yes stop_codon:yes gene_type:complete
MIIIAENKKNHYMIKNFLVDFKNYQSINENNSEKFHPVFKLPGQDNPVGEYPIITDKDDRPATKKEIEFVAKKNPKYKSFLNKFLSTSKFIMPFMAAVLLYNSTNINSKEEKAAIEHIKKANSPKNVENIIQNNESEDLVFSLEYDKKADREEVKQSILGHEGFKGLPYLDHHQWSVGHGTKAFSDADLDEGEHERLEKDFEKQRKKGVSRAEWINKTIPDWRKKFFDTYSIQADNESKTAPINLQQAGIAADQEVAHVIAKMNKVKYFKVLPKDTKQAFYDMAYNMGPGFLDKFKNFNETMHHAAIVLDSEDLNEEEVKVAINLFEIAAEEILYNFNEDGTIKGKTKYHSDLQKSGRPQENYALIKKGIEEIRISITPRNFQNKNTNESLRKVYSNLFV